jgi:hypothetical protein
MINETPICQRIGLHPPQIQDFGCFPVGRAGSRGGAILEHRTGAQEFSLGAEMSKIPQGEWSAIAARYENGESISGIARNYDCTPPAIHYILKRYYQGPANAVKPLSPGPRAAVPVRDSAAEATPTPALLAGKSEHAIPPPGLVRAIAPIAAATACRQTASEPSQRVAIPTLTPGLDRELHIRAEAAIEMFRSSFDAALTEVSPGVRERLRQAAAELMRVAARTTIVLDRLNAGSERSGRVQNYPRSAHARDDFGKLDSA